MPIPYTKPAPPNDDKRWKIVETRMRRMGDRPAALIEALHAAQEAFGFLDDAALNYVGDTLGVPHSRVYGVATFYSFFTLKPQGEHTCVVCTGTATVEIEGSPFASPVTLVSVGGLTASGVALFMSGRAKYRSVG